MRCPSRLVALLIALAWPLGGCTIGRYYIGNEVPNVADGRFVPGTTTKAQVLRDIGPPDRLVRQYDGDVFVYQYRRQNLGKLELQEPIITHYSIFTWEKVEEKSDRLVVMFDRAGTLVSVGYLRGTEALKPY
jgi:hypothetical protein